MQVCSAVQLSGFLLCLSGAARITHRAQGIVSVATRWHMIETCASSGSPQCQTRQALGKLIYIYIYIYNDANTIQVWTVFLSMAMFSYLPFNPLLLVFVCRRINIFPVV